MKTLVVLALATVFSTVAIPGASAQAPAGDWVAGQATSCGAPDFGCPGDFFDSVDLEARSGPNGEHPTGTAGFEHRASQLDLPLEGPVRCLAVSGKTAIVGFFQAGPTIATATVIRVIDGGSAAGEDSFEIATTISEGSAPVPGCSKFRPRWSPSCSRASMTSATSSSTTPSTTARRRC